MTRLFAPLLLVLATTTSAMAGFVFEIPRLDFPTPDTPVATDDASTQNR